MGVLSDVSADDTARLQIQHARIRGPTHEITPQDMRDLLQYVSKERLVRPHAGPTEASADLLIEGDTIVFDPKADDPLGIRGCEIQIPPNAKDRLTFAFGGQPVLLGDAEKNVSDLPIIGFSIPNGPQFNALAKYGVTLPGIEHPQSGRAEPIKSEPLTDRALAASDRRTVNEPAQPIHTTSQLLPLTQQQLHTSAQPQRVSYTRRQVAAEEAPAGAPAVKRALESRPKELQPVITDEGNRAQEEYYKMYEQEYRAQRQELRQRRSRRAKRESRLEARPNVAACGLEPPAVGALMGAALQATQNWLSSMTGTHKDPPGRKSSYEERRRRVLDAAKTGSQIRVATKKATERQKREPSPSAPARQRARVPQVKVERRRSSSRVPTKQAPAALPATLSPRTRGPPPSAAPVAHDAQPHCPPQRAETFGPDRPEPNNFGRGLAPVRANLLLQRPPPLQRAQTDVVPAQAPVQLKPTSMDDLHRRPALSSPPPVKPVSVIETPRHVPIETPAQDSEAFMKAERDLMVHIIGRQVAAQQLQQTIQRATAELGLAKAPTPDAILNLGPKDPAEILAELLTQAKAQAETKQQQQSQAMLEKLEAEPKHQPIQQLQPQAEVPQQRLLLKTHSTGVDERGPGGVMGREDGTESLCGRGFVEAGEESAHKLMRLPMAKSSVKYSVKNPATDETREVEVVSVCHRPEIQLVRHLLSEMEAHDLEELLEDVQSLPHLPQNLLDNDALDDEDMNMIKTIVSRVASVTEVSLENVLAVCPSTVEFTAKDQTKEFTNLIRIYVDDIHEGYESAFPGLGLALRPRRGFALRWACMDAEGNKDVRAEHEEVVAPGKRRLMLTIYVR